MKPFKLQNKPTTGFQIPDGYFDAMQQQVRAKTAAPKVIPLYRKKGFYAAAAAVLVVGLSIGYLWQTPSPADAATIENYLAQQPQTQEMLVEALDAADIEQLAHQYHSDSPTLEEALLQTDFETLIQ